jgi:acyl-CoA reductase-like NAD-dependent aldehyde dehydrogenase
VTFSLWIDGAPRQGSGGAYDVVNPANETIVAAAPRASTEDGLAAIDAAARALPAWSRTTPQERSALLLRTAELIESAADLPVLLQSETGSTVAFAAAAVPNATARLQWFAEHALHSREIPFSPQPVADGSLLGSYATRLPVGVVLCITSYNVPMSNVCSKIAPALAMGNTVVIKPADQDPLGVIRLVELMHEAGFPPGVVNVVAAGAEETAAMVDSPLVDMVSFTGSTAVGKKIAAAAGGDIKRLLLELGGKGAGTVFRSADLASATKGIGSTFTLHSGQICTAPTRMLAHRSVYDQMVERLAELARTAVVGDPTDPATDIGPMISAAHLARVESYVESARREGATIVTGGVRPPIDKGFYITPTVITDVTAQATVFREEIFGPVLVAMPFDDDEEAVALANATEYGLYDYIWSGDRVQALRVAPMLRTGGVGINTIGRHREAPFGGFGHSGVGRDWGLFGLQAYSELQSVVWTS